MSCGCSGGNSGGGFSSGGGFGNRLRYQVVSNGFTVSYGSMKDAERHRDQHGGQIKVLKPGQRS